MLNRKMLALILVGALALGGVSVLAADQGGETAVPQEQEQQTQDIVQQPTPLADEGKQDDTAAQSKDESLPEQAGQEQAKPTPDPEGTMSFANLEQRVREGNLNYLVLQESIARIEANDYDKMKEDLREALNDIASAQWGLLSAGSSIAGIPGLDPAVSGALQGIAGMSASSASMSLQAQYDALRDQFDDLKDGKIQEQAADGIRQLKATQNSLVMVSQGMYVQLSEINAARQTLERALATLDRQVVEMQLRYDLGQISALTLQQVKGARTALASQRQSLDTTAQTLGMNLQAMVGGELTGPTKLAALPVVSQEQLGAMNLEQDLQAAKQASYHLYAAKKTRDDAEEDYKDVVKYNYNEKKYQHVQAKHTWQAAQYTYDGAVQSFELSFRSLFAQVKDYQQVLEATKVSLAVEQDNYGVDQLKYEQGTISKNTLLSAQDDLDAAKDAVDTAQRNLFSAYNNYCWAVEYGVLN